MRGMTSMVAAIQCCIYFALMVSTASMSNFIRTEKNQNQQDAGLWFPDGDSLIQLSSFRFWGHNVTASLEVSLLQQAPVLQKPAATDGFWGYRLAKGTGQESYSQWKQDRILQPILSKLGKGFFVESGAIDGEIDSNTLFYELRYGWTGLLVEPDPNWFPRIKGKHRRAYAFNGCLSPTNHAMTLEFQINSEGQSAISTDGSNKYKVQAQPLQALLEAIGQKTVDFWSLDIEGSEGKVLENTDFSKVEVGVLLIEMNKEAENNKAIRAVMKKEGFQEIGHTMYREDVTKKKGVLDHIFVNPKYFMKRKIPVPTAGVLPFENRN
jgi:FkbM family methyltransferase